MMSGYKEQCQKWEMEHLYDPLANEDKKEQHYEEENEYYNVEHQTQSRCE